jgi:hypothetical protein
VDIALLRADPRNLAVDILIINNHSGDIASFMWIGKSSIEREEVPE